MVKSAAWDHFSKIENNTKVKCGKCGEVLTFKKSTTNMISHLDKSHNIKIAKLPPKGGRKRRFNLDSDVRNSGSEDSPDSAADFEVSILIFEKQLAPPRCCARCRCAPRLQSQPAASYEFTHVRR